ncbi:ComEA family DNA-binding protein [Amycolatopsis saalfeldensis]|uniref:Competence protein ComEA n=1 Tax=Amycolatopsis saalfeldensis TaxID=394193 RepID=A0A1H8Y162_9PSEU|nr:ComEA family DNA-binding protein [Amycolatopsis saalfeldensis]SEP45777.1 competence protein ComEA [Amycolatopsis saalfeldensis]
MFEQTARDPGSPVNARLAWLADQLAAGPTTVGPGGRLVRRWLPAGTSLPGRRALPGLSGLPGRLGRRWVLVAAVFAAVVALGVAGFAIFGGSAPTAEAPPPLPVARAQISAAAPSSGKLVISVVGHVRAPGLITVPSGARVDDALRAAGGADPGTDLTGLNLARKLTDGEQLAVGITVAAAPAPAGPAGAGAAPGKVDLNSATPEQLDTLPGVGEVTAKRIVDWRTQHGGFSSVEQLRDVDGIGASKFDKLREQVSVG